MVEAITLKSAFDFWWKLISISGKTFSIDDMISSRYLGARLGHFKIFSFTLMMGSWLI
jgi:hypothetical protein